MTYFVENYMSCLNRSLKSVCMCLYVLLNFLLLLTVVCKKEGSSF